MFYHVDVIGLYGLCVKAPPSPFLVQLKTSSKNVALQMPHRGIMCVF